MLSNFVNEECDHSELRDSHSHHRPSNDVVMTSLSDVLCSVLDALDALEMSKHVRRSLERNWRRLVSAHIEVSHKINASFVVVQLRMLRQSHRLCSAK
jgi:hypothetical protein